MPLNGRELGIFNRLFEQFSTGLDIRFLYGIRNGILLFPLDTVIHHFNPDTPDATGAFVGASIAGAGFLIGTVALYMATRRRS